MLQDIYYRHRIKFYLHFVIIKEFQVVIKEFQVVIKVSSFVDNPESLNSFEAYFHNNNNNELENSKFKIFENVILIFLNMIFISGDDLPNEQHSGIKSIN